MSNQPSEPQNAALPGSQGDADAGAADGDYAVGYRRPPVATRFKPGASGNPRGRPKAPKSAGKSLKDAMARYMTVVENGRKRKIRAQELIIQGLVNDAARGKPHAVKLLFSLADRYGQNDEQEIDPASFQADDQALIESYLASLRALSEDHGDVTQSEATTPQKSGDQPVGVAKHRRG